MENLKFFLLESIKSEIEDYDDVAILFSGGTDSLTCLFSCLELGIRPKLYTFHLDGYLSEDAKYAKKIAEYFQLDLDIIVIKTDQEILFNNIIYLIKTYDIYNKIRLQILYPFPFLFSKIKEKYVITGLSADTLYGTNYHSKLKGVKEFNEMRKNSLILDEIDGYEALKNMAIKFSKKLVAPYRKKQTIDYFLSHSWDQLNKPIQKNLSVKAFDNYFKLEKFYRESSSLPINSKLNKLLETLIDSKLNEHNRETIEEIFKDIYYDKIKFTSKVKNNKFLNNH